MCCTIVNCIQNVVVCMLKPIRLLMKSYCSLLKLKLGFACSNRSIWVATPITKCKYSSKHSKSYCLFFGIALSLIVGFVNQSQQYISCFTSKVFINKEFIVPDKI